MQLNTLIKLNALLFFLFTPLIGCEQNNDEATQDTVLSVEQAFPLSVSQQQNAVTITWNSPPGYYLYANKISVKSLHPDADVRLTQQPKPVLQDDPVSHEPVQVHRDRTTFNASIHPKKALDAIDVEIKYQGCADRGLCYPPQTVIKTIQPVFTAPTPFADQFNTKAPFSLSGDNGIPGLGFSPDQPLSPDQAFQFSADVIDGDTLFAAWSIAPDHYLYRDKIRFTSDHPNIKIGPVQWPPAITKDDPEFGATAVYHDQLNVTIPLVRTGPQPASVTLTARYLGCAEKLGICYPPQTKQVTLTLPASQLQSPTTLAPVATLSEQDQFYAILNDKSLLTAVALFFVAGLLLSLTPCVYPMLPILSGIIAGQSNTSPRKAFILTMTYVLSVAVVYTVAGVAAALAGANLQALFQDPWVISLFALVFVGLSLSMFGFYELQLPSSWQNKLNAISHNQQGGTIISTAIMGALSALIVSPCVTAPMVGALYFISETGDAVFGGLVLFSLSMGMSVPLIILGVAEGSLLPKAGHWMNAVKAIFGVLMLAISIWLLDRIIPGSITLALWGLLLITSSIYLSALEPLPIEATGWRRLWKGFGVAALTYGVILLLGAASGQNNPLAPLRAFDRADTRQTSAPAQTLFTTVRTEQALKQALAAAQQANQVAMIDVYAQWCAYCKQLDRTTFADPEVQAQLNAFATIKLDITEYTDEAKRILASFGIASLQPPIQLFVDQQGIELKRFRVVGYQNAKQFLISLNKVSTR